MRNIVLATFLALLALAALPHAADSANWSMYSVNKGEAYLYDQDSIKSTGQSVQVWTRLVMGTKSIDEIANMLGKKYENVTYSNYLEELQCSEKKIRILAIVFYSKDNDAIEYINYNDPKWVAIPPETVFDRLHREVCK